MPVPFNINDAKLCDFSMDLIDSPWLHLPFLLKTEHVVNVSHVPGFECSLPGRVDQSLHERYAQLLGIEKKDIRLAKWAPTPQEDIMARTWIDQNLPGDSPVVFFQYHATSPVRRLWPETVYAIYDGLVSRKLRIVVAFMDRADPKYIGLVPRKVRTLGNLPITLSCAILARADLCISVDTGFFHLAGAMGIPTISLFGPTGFQPTARYYPMARENPILQEIPCAGCYYRKAHGYKEECAEVGCQVMRQHKAESVLEQLDWILSGRAEKRGVSVDMRTISSSGRVRVLA
jgi:hypothetical protein